MPATHDLQRFLDAQADTYATALAEIRAGRKRSHWMWFIFPQIQGLGRSETAQYYAIASRDEASAYLAHPLLGSRLREITAAALEHPELSATALFGQPDDLKFHSRLRCPVPAGSTTTSPAVTATSCPCSPPRRRVA